MTMTQTNEASSLFNDVEDASESHLNGSYQQQRQNSECFSIRSESLPLQRQEEHKTTKLCGRLLLVVVAILYGTLNVSLRLVYSLPDPPSASALSCTRGWLAALCFLPILQLRVHKQHQDNVQTTLPSRPMWIVALELAGWNFGAQGLVNLGLLSVESARGASGRTSIHSVDVQNCTLESNFIIFLLLQLLFSRRLASS